MARLSFILIMLVMLVSCRATRNVEQQSIKGNVDSVTTDYTHTEMGKRLVDTTRTEMGKVTITEITFFHPDSLPEDTQLIADARLPALGNVKGAIKGIKQMTIEKGIEQSGKSDESKESTESRSYAELSKRQSQVQKQETAKPSSNCRYAICSVALLATALLLYLKRKPILNQIRKILAGIRKVL